VQRKVALGQKLTGAEERLWQTVTLQQTLNLRQRLVADADQFHIVRTLDAEPIVEAVKALGEIERPRRDAQGRLHVASVDPLTAANWARECGHAIGTKPFIEYAKKKLMSGEFAKFRINRPKRYV
jgi:hypothetical protein